MRLKWEKIICDETMKKKEKMPSSWKDYPLDPFEQDYREIISSVTFRRLQDKTQVYPLDSEDFVRTRLTHSIEVSTLAKSLSAMIFLNERWKDVPAIRELSAAQRQSIMTILACAGLLHDMGNPPFGHEGEYAISAFFRDAFSKDELCMNGRPIREILSKEQIRDLTQFDGNAEIIRILSHCVYDSEEQEANVTYATLSTLIKYPVSSDSFNENSTDVRIHKFGYFLSEQDFAREVREKTGLILQDEPHARNPLTYILEAADDIAYVASDVEDAVSKGAITVGEMISFIEDRIEELPKDGDEQHQMQVLTVRGMVQNLKKRMAQVSGGSSAEQVTVMHSWTNYLRNWLLYVAASSFCAHAEEIMNGTFKGELLTESPHKYTISILKDLMRRAVYTTLTEVYMETYRVIEDALSKFVKVAVAYDSGRELSRKEEVFLRMIPNRYRVAYENEKTNDPTMNLYLRIRMVIDYIASMTDRRLLYVYRITNGVPVIK